MVLMIALVIAILQIVGMWKVFTKAGEKGWKCIIPIYNIVILFRISGLSPWIIFGYLAGIIPFIGWIVCLGIYIYQCNSLAKAFGKDIGYTIGLLFLPTIFYMILDLVRQNMLEKEMFQLQVLIKVMELLIFLKNHKTNHQQIMMRIILIYKNCGIL